MEDIEKKIVHNMAEEKNPYDALPCNYSYDYCASDTCWCDKRMGWNREHKKAEYAESSQETSIVTNKK
jgi:hypothetical protein